MPKEHYQININASDPQAALEDLIVQLNNILIDISTRISYIDLTGDVGYSGYYDDGTNFRTTVTNGVITDVSDSTSGGHDP